MNRLSVRALTLLAVGAALHAASPVVEGSGGAGGEMASAPVHRLGDDLVVREWVVLGPFPNTETGSESEGNIRRAAFDRDDLVPLGGEEQAVIVPGTSVEFTNTDGETSTVQAVLAKVDNRGAVDLDSLFEGPEYVSAYAFACLEAQEDATAHVFFGSDDGAKVWVNGELVHSLWEPTGRPWTAREDHFTFDVRAGLNPVLVKVEDREHDWKFSLEVAAGEQAEAILAEMERHRLLRELMDEELQVGDGWDFTFRSEEFPRIRWKNPYLVEQVIGDSPLTVRWFDGDLNEVTTASAAGRYGAYVEARSDDGSLIRRALTFYRHPEDWHPWRNRAPIAVRWLQGAGVAPEVWAAFADRIADAESERFVEFLFTDERGAILLAGLAETEALDGDPTQLDWPEMRDQDYHLALKRKILGLPDLPGLSVPGARDGEPATVLRAGEPAEAEVKAHTADRIRAACAAWWEASKEPFTALVARHGVVVFHEAFGETSDGPVTLETRYPMASITKMLTGLLFVQFIDQGLAHPEDPIGRFLPDFPVDGPKTITFRHCFMHTTGLWGHGEWGGMNNPWLDNVIANGLEILTPGERNQYNGMGFDLAGKAMEVAAGKSIFRLMQEHFFLPLGIEGATIVDLGYGTMFTAEDLAKVGQLMINRGSYGNVVFFSPQSFEEMMPVAYEDVFPAMKGSKNTYGFGFHPIAEKPLGPDGKEIEGAEPILSSETFGHGSASSTVIRVDFDHDLVVAVTRFSAGPGYDKHLRNVLTAVAESLL